MNKRIMLVNIFTALPSDERNDFATKLSLFASQLSISPYLRANHGASLSIDCPHDQSLRTTARTRAARAQMHDHRCTCRQSAASGTASLN
eukprot:4875510-Pleurochrysis_carterae.AAC.1